MRWIWTSLLVTALLAVQSMGQWHRLVHVDRDHTVNTGLTQSAPATVAKLFSNHHSDTDCQLFDQLSHADSVTAIFAIAVAVAVLPRYLRASHGLAVARWHALFQARGPPSVR